MLESNPCLPFVPIHFDHVISLTINGEPRRFQAPLKVEQLLETLALTGKRVALERNGDIVPRSRFGEEWLSDGDRIEIVVAVGGG
jgi:sulfur carrier protein